MSENTNTKPAAVEQQQATPEELAPAKPSSKPASTDLKTLAIEHLAKCREYQFSDTTDPKTGKTVPRFKGQPGYNPFMYYVQVLQPLEDKLASGVAISEEELAAILKIKVETEPNGDAVKITQMGLREYIEKS